MQWSDAYEKYNHNVFRHLSYIHRYMHETLNNRLIAVGYLRFKMSFIDVIPYLKPEGIRLTDLVALHQLPKATMARLINSIHHQGFVDKRPDPSDTRANILFITEKGVKLIETASQMATEILDELNSLMGASAFEDFRMAVHHCFTACSLPYPPVRSYLQGSPNLHPHGQLQMELNSVVKYIDLKLFESNKVHGYGDLQNAHRSVLEHISENGTRASVIAKKEGITKQSISDISHVLIQKKYLKRIKDPDDKRAHRLAFSDKGKKMMATAMDELQNIEHFLEGELGEVWYEKLLLQSERLWFLLDGKSPDSTCGSDFSALDSMVTPLLQSLLVEVQQYHSELLPRAFHKDDGGYRINEALVKYIQTKKIPFSE